MMIVFAQHACAAVLILEGSAPKPPVVATPAPQDEPPLPASPGISLKPVTGPAAATTPAPAIETPAPAIEPSLPAASADLLDNKVANSAEVSVEMIPGQTVSVGSEVSFRVTCKKAGYLVLVDVDATGHLAQIYPNPASLTRTNRPNGNYIKPGGTLTVPLANDPYAGVKYVVSPPNGQAMIVAILSAHPVQILDLPDLPPNTKDKSDVLVFLSKWTIELRIPDDDSKQLRETKWSFNAKSYTIR